MSSDPVADVTTGHAFIRSNTGLLANTLLMDFDTYQTARRHPVLLDMYKYTQGGLVNDAELQAVIKVGRILVSNAIRNAALENAPRPWSTSGATTPCSATLPQHLLGRGRRRSGLRSAG